MNDLRHDQEAADERTHYNLRTVPKPKPAEAFAAIRAQFGAQFDAMDPDNLRTVRMPDLRSGECRTLDAAARGLDTRTADAKTTAALVGLVDTLQAAMMRLELRVEELERGRNG